MSIIETILGAMFAVVTRVTGRIVDFLLSKPKLPKLKLTYDVVREMNALPRAVGAGRIWLFIENTGKEAASGAVIDLLIYTPRWVHPGKGLIFEDEPGSWENLDGLIDGWGPRHYGYRMKTEKIINPGDDPLKIAGLPFLLRSNKPHNYRIEWQISHPKIPKTKDSIILTESELRQKLGIR